MTRMIGILPLAALVLAGCDPVSGTDVRISGGGAVGVSTSGSYGYSGYVGGGPPPGRTDAERAARRAYYRGPRGGDGFR